MSTKTTFKRVALVAVASLGFGVLTSVAPASAALSPVTSITAGTSGATRVGVASSNTVTLNGTFASTETVTVSAKVISAPAGSAFATSRTSGSYATGIQESGTPNPAVLTITVGTAGAGAPSAFSVTGAAAAADDENYVTAVFTTTSGATAGTTLPARISTTPDVAGTYQVLVSVASTNRTQAAGSFVAGDVSTIYTFTTAGAPATVTMTPVGSTADTDTTGRLVRITLKDAAGNATVPGDAESINLSSDKASTTFGVATSGNPSANPTATTIGLGTANFYATGSAALVRVKGAAGTTVVTASGGGTIPVSVSTQGSLVFLASTITNSSNPVLSLITATVAYPENGYGVMPTVSGNAATVNVVPTSTARSWRVAFTNSSTTAAAVAQVTITDISGLITGVANATYTQAVSIAASGTGANFTVSTLSALSNGRTYSAAVTSAGTAVTDLTTLTVNGQTVSSTSDKAAVTAVGVTAFTSAPASTVTQTVKLTDQFGAAVANAPITVTITGRNAAKSGSVLITDASGLATYALLDAGTAGTTDTLDFASSSAIKTAAATTITWGTVSISTVTLNGGNTTAGVADTTNTVRDINAGDGVQSTKYDISATLKNANGVLQGGVPVVFSVAGSGVAITSTTINGVSNSAGLVTAKVYGWIAGTYTVTAVAGGVTATGTITFGQTAKGDERAVSATVSGPMVVAKVVDRFGNPVPFVTVYATKSGVGYFGTGVTSTKADTNAAGIAEFVTAGGSVDVTVSTIDPALVAGAFGTGQTSAPKGYLGNSLTAAGLAALAFTASTTGTAIKDEVGVGASFDAAGVASVTVSVVADTSIANAIQAAADAAAEAIDAGNNANESAVAAAEAAEAATAAAEEAGERATAAAEEATAAAEAATDAANEALDAANAATDAANASAEAADAATAAAQDAADAVAALSVQVTEMIDALKKQITSLTNLVIKIQKKVKA